MYREKSKKHRGPLKHLVSVKTDSIQYQFGIIFDVPIRFLLSSQDGRESVGLQWSCRRYACGDIDPRPEAHDPHLSAWQWEPEFQDSFSWLKHQHKRMCVQIPEPTKMAIYVDFDFNGAFFCVKQTGNHGFEQKHGSFGFNVLSVCFWWTSQVNFSCIQWQSTLWVALQPYFARVK